MKGIQITQYELEGLLILRALKEGVKRFEKLKGKGFVRLNQEWLNNPLDTRIKHGKKRKRTSR